MNDAPSSNAAAAPPRGDRPAAVATAAAGPSPPPARPGLRTHLIALVLAVLLPALAVGAGAAWQAVEGQRAAFEARLRDTTRALVLALDAELRTSLQGLAVLAAARIFDAGAGTDPEAADLLLRRASESLGMPVSLLAPDGRHIAHSDARPGVTPPPTRHTEALRRAIATGQPVVNDLAPGVVAGRPIASIFVPVTREGRAVAALGARLEPDRLARLLAAQRFGEGHGFATLVDANGTVVARSRDHAAFLGRRIPDWFPAATAGRDHGIVAGPALAGPETVFGFERLRNAPGWLLVVAEPATAYAESWQRPLHSLVLGGLAALLLGTLTALLLGRRLIGPMDALMARAAAVATTGGGGPPPAATPPAGVREFEALRHSLVRAEATLRSRAEAEAAAAAALRESEARAGALAAEHAAVLGQLAEGVIVTDPSGRIVFVNEAAARLHGAARLDVTPEAYSETYRLFTEDGRPFPPEELPLARAVLRGETVTEARWRIRRPDGTEVLAVGSARPLRAPGGDKDGGGGGAPAGAVLTLRDDTARAAAEAALRESEARFRALFEATPVGVMLRDPESLRILAMNEHGRRLLGYTAEEVAGLTLAEFVVGLDAERLRARGRDLLASRGRSEIEARHRTKSGELRDVLVSSEPLVLDGRPLVCSAWTDITGRKRTEAALAESAARLRAMADNIPQLAWMARPDGWIFWYNRRWHDHTGTTAEEMEGWGWRAVQHPDHLARVEAGFRRSVEAGEPWEDTFPLRAADGAWRWFLSRAVPVRDGRGDILLWFGTNTDVTAQRAAEAARAESEERLRLAIEGTGLATWDIDLATDAAVWSPNHFALLGLPPDPEGRAHAAMWRDRIHPEDRPAVEAAVAEARARREPFRTAYRIHRADDGAERWVETLGRHMDFAPDGAPRRMVGTVLDITDRRHAEERERLLTREVDHRARNALAVVQALLNLTPAQGEEAKRFAATVSDRVAAMARAHALLAKERWRGAELRSLIEDELAPYAPAGEAGHHRLRLDGPALRLPPELAQPLSMVLHELATNAAKYGALSAPGGRVAVTWRRGPAGDGVGDLRLDWRETGGPRLEAPPARTGFGSRLVQATARQMGGGVAFAWEPEGLHCTLRLPAARLRPGGPAAEAGAALRDAAD